MTNTLQWQHAADCINIFAVSLWQRFVTTFREDQDLLVSEFADASKGYGFRPIVSNYQGNPQAVITHPKGDAQQYAR